MKFLTCFLFATLLLAGCNKEENPFKNDEGMLYPSGFTFNSSIDNTSRTETYGYDKKARLTRVTASDGSKREFTYNGEHLLTIKSTNRIGIVQSYLFTYDGEKLVSGILSTYSDNKLTSTTTIVYTTNDNGKVVSGRLSGSLNATFFATWKGNNLTSILVTNSSLKEWTYSDLIDPFASQTALQNVFDPFNLSDTFCSVNAIATFKSGPINRTNYSVIEIDYLEDKQGFPTVRTNTVFQVTNEQKTSPELLGKASIKYN